MATTTDAVDRIFLIGDAMVKGYADLADLPENERIRIIGHRAIQHLEIVAFIVEDDVKADRYIKKLTDNFGTIRIIDRSKFAGQIMVRVGPPVQIH